MRHAAALTLTVTVVLLLVSMVLHMPTEVQSTLFGRRLLEAGSIIYCDVYSQLHDTLVESYSKPPWRVIADLKPTQPPLAWITVLLATALSRFLASSASDFLVYFYLIYSAISTAAVSYGIYRLVRARSIYLYPVYATTLLVYGVYSYDSLALPLIAEAVVSIREGEVKRALFYSTLSFTTSFYSIVVLGLLVYLLLRDPNLDESIYTGMLYGLIPLLLVLAVDPSYIKRVVSSVIQAGFNNGLLQVLTPWLSVEAAYGLNMGLWILLLLTLYAVSPSLNERERLTMYIPVVMLLLYSLHPQPVPQTLLLILPLIPTLFVRRDARLLLTVEFLNALIIILWFKAGVIAEALRSIGLDASPNPLSLENPIQWISITRDSMLAVYALQALKEVMEADAGGGI
ncbi:MAG: hypothetical protein OWQ48_01615 [Desulfurococcus sp.]|nr:hypothetical protein [Desulfurococcus sp.]